MIFNWEKCLSVRERLLGLKVNALFAVYCQRYFVWQLQPAEHIENSHELVAHWREKGILVCCNPFFDIDWICHFSRWLSSSFWAELSWNVTHQRSCHGTENQSSVGEGLHLLLAMGERPSEHCALWAWDWSFVQGGCACVSVFAGCIAIIDQSVGKKNMMFLFHSMSLSVLSLNKA